MPEMCFKKKLTLVGDMMPEMYDYIFLPIVFLGSSHSHLLYWLGVLLLLQDCVSNLFSPSSIPTTFNRKQNIQEQ